MTTAEGQPSFCVDVEGPGAAATEVVESGGGEVNFNVFGTASQIPAPSLYPVLTELCLVV